MFTLNLPGRVSGKKNIWVQNIVKSDQVVLDWSTGNVYYSRQGSGEVVVCSGDEARCSLVVDVNVGTITQMAVDAAEVSGIFTLRVFNKLTC